MGRRNECTSQSRIEGNYRVEGVHTNIPNANGKGCDRHSGDETRGDHSTAERNCLAELTQPDVLPDTGASQSLDGNSMRSTFPSDLDPTARGRPIEYSE
jgi:hypothetical protein